MEKKLNRKLFIIPTIYLLLAGMFFYLHYSQRIHFSQAIGNIELTGQSTKGSMVKSSEIKKLNIYVNGMSFRFNSKNELIVKTADNILHKAELQDYSSNRESFTLHFENNINLIFKTDFADNKISISAVLPETVPSITALTLPFMEDRGFSLGFTEEDNTPVISNGETNFFIALTNEYKLDNESKNITIEVLDNTPITFMIQDTLVSRGRTAEKWYEQNDADIETEYETVVSNYVNNAFFGWNSRFNSKTGMWSDGEGIQRFNETTATSYLSESLVRGSYRTSASLIRTASVNVESDLTAQTAPYLGNIVEKGSKLITSQSILKQEINNLIANNSRDILKVNNLINFLLNNKLENEIENIMAIAMTATENEISTESIYRLKIINDGYSYVEDELINSAMVEIIEESILPSVTWLDEGLFLEKDTIINVEESFTAGKELLIAGNLLDNDFYSTVGQEMIISILSRSKESSFLPSTINIENNRITNESGTLLPEDFYYELTESPYYLKQENLVKSLGTGSWILTCAESYDIQKTTRETNLTLDFPKGSTHYFAIKGVKPFVRIYMHGSKWPSDPNFQRYSDGWLYDKTNKMLYVKMKHREDRERIRILYYNPDSQGSSPASTPTAPSDTSAGTGETSS